MIINKNKEIIKIKKVKNNILQLNKKEQTDDYRNQKNINYNILNNHKKNLNLYCSSKKIIFLNNYSITNIPNIEFKKIILPEKLNISDNTDFFNKTALSNNNSFKKIKNSPFKINNYYDDKFEANRNFFTKINKKYNVKTSKHCKSIDSYTINNNNKINLNSKDNNKFDFLRIVNLIKKDNQNKNIDSSKRIRFKNFSKGKHSQKNNSMRFRLADSEKHRENPKNLFKNDKY
jgi:hypothetical protein